MAKKKTVLTAGEVIDAIVKAKTSGLKAKARRLLNKYVEQQRKDGHEPTRTVAALKAVITRYHKSKHNGMLE